MVRNIRPDVGRLSAAGAGAGVAGFGDVEDGGGAAAVAAGITECLTSTGSLQGRTQGRRAPRARRSLTGVNGDGHLLVLDQQSEICGHVGAPF